MDETKMKSIPKNYLLIDINAIFYKTLFALQKNEKEEDLYDVYTNDRGELKKKLKDDMFNNNYKSYFWNMMFGIVQKFGDVKQIVTCHDNHSWRYKIFPYYKKSRSTQTAGDCFDWRDFFNKVRKFQKEELDVYSPFISLDVNDCEGDDIIGTIAVGLAQEHPDATVYIYSSDKDFIQLLKYPNIKLFSILKKKFITSLNPKNDLLAQILLGDSCDGIPHVRNSSDYYVKPILERTSSGRAKCTGARLGEAVVRKAINDNKVFETIVNTPEIQARFNENQNLIDLERIPIDIKKNIFNTYHKLIEHHKSKSPAGLQRYFIMNGFQYLSQSCYKVSHLF